MRDFDAFHREGDWRAHQSSPSHSFLCLASTDYDIQQHEWTCQTWEHDITHIIIITLSMVETWRATDTVIAVRSHVYDLEERPVYINAHWLLERMTNEHDKLVSRTRMIDLSNTSSSRSETTIAWIVKNNPRRATPPIISQVKTILAQYEWREGVESGSHSSMLHSSLLDLYLSKKRDLSVTLGWIMLMLCFVSTSCLITVAFSKVPMKNEVRFWKKTASHDNGDRILQYVYKCRVKSPESIH